MKKKGRETVSGYMIEIALKFKNTELWKKEITNTASDDETTIYTQIETEALKFLAQKDLIDDYKRLDKDFSDELKKIVYKKLKKDRKVKITLKNVKDAYRIFREKQRKENTVTCAYCKNKFDKRKTEYRYKIGDYYHKNCYEEIQRKENTVTCAYCKQQFDKRKEDYTSHNDEYYHKDCYEKHKKEIEEAKKKEEIQKLKDKIKEYQKKAEFCKQQKLEIQHKRALDKIKLLNALIVVKQYNYNEYNSDENDEYIDVESYSNDIPFRCLTELQKFKETVAKQIKQQIKDIEIKYYIVEDEDDDPVIVVVIKTDFYDTEIEICSW